MKTAIKFLLGAAALMLAWFCVSSILTPIHFEETKANREKEVIAALINIRKAEIEYKNQHGTYTASFDTLISFLKNGKMKQLKKEGTLTDQQLEKGLTEAKATAIVKRGNAKEIAEYGLQGFSRDTAYVNVLSALFNGVYDEKTIENIRKVPYTNGKDFELEIGFQKKNSIKLPLFEARAPYEWYLGDLDHQELINLIEVQEEYNRYPGLKVGDVNEPNNNSGNWES